MLGLDWSLDEHRKFVYDGYKLVAEFDALNSDALLANYLWQPMGLDVPLMRTANSANEYFVADGNKNVIELRDATGVIMDTYDYTPFGGVTHAGSSDNPFQFSSEYHDSETGLIYYNYRYYSPVLGRWINRDPIEEEGGMNLYGMCENDNAGKLDKLGLWTGGVHGTITTQSFNAVIVESMYKKEDASKVAKVRSMIIDANKATDSGTFANSMQYHYNRPLTAITDTEIETWRMNYSQLIITLDNNFSDELKEQQPTLKNCSNALVFLGRASHVWQDYYAHAIANGSNGSKNSIGNIEGSPFSVSRSLKPSSWGSIWSRGEHGASEPGNRAPDATVRNTASETTTTSSFTSRLRDTWWPKCWCLYAKTK
ncbi:hypothetical protein SDC9_127469 [bioreactor metagenome]|uniref:Teneurin-like YD-shell domain-containing protein n=1 Tax=bioreactor metagenome TaxID=1076179 RepID=A0A645CUP0_9ZZZZ